LRENRIDLLLTYSRNAIETLSIFMTCKFCATSVEQNMLIAMIMRQISLICGKTANCYKAMHLHNSTSNTNSSSRQQSELDGSIGIDILVSSYRVTRQEMLHSARGSGHASDWRVPAPPQYVQGKVSEPPKTGPDGGAEGGRGLYQVGAVGY
jgi:hypothetical protein